MSFFLVFVVTAYADENFILMDAHTGEVLQVFGAQVEEQVSPCSTFKVLLSLMGFDSGILLDEEHPKWPFKEGYYDYFPFWRTEQTPRSWMKKSCVWYSQVLAQAMGLETIQNYLGKMQYGNRDMSGDPGKNNGLMRAWSSSSLKISLKEQVGFLRQLVQEDLPFSPYAIEMTKRLIFMEELTDGWKLFGKTGAGVGGEDKEIPVLGWFVGWIEKEGEAYVFAYNILEHNCDLRRRIPRVKELLFELLGTN